MSHDAVSSLSGLRALALALILAFGGSTLLAGCDDQGPAEDAGESIDDTAEDVGDSIEDTFD